MAGHTLPVGDLRETREKIEENESLQNSGGGDADVCEDTDKVTFSREVFELSLER